MHLSPSHASLLLLAAPLSATLACGASVGDAALEVTLFDATLRAVLHTELGCPTFADATATLDGVEVDVQPGGLAPSFGSPWGNCLAPAVHGALEEDGEGALVVVDEAGGVGRWRAVDEPGARLVPLDDLAAARAGATLRFRAEPGGARATSCAFDVTRSDDDSLSDLLSLRPRDTVLSVDVVPDDEGVCAFTLPADCPAMEGGVRAQLAFAVASEACDGFAGCAAEAVRSERFDVTVID